MNSLYKLPLHGVACLPICDPIIHNVLHNITISFHPLTAKTTANLCSNKPDWVMSDTGERYKTEVSLYINNESAQPTQTLKSSSTNNKNYTLKVDCQGKGLFHINKNNINVYWDDVGTDSSHYFQTLGLALWLELNNILCIHANALAYKNNAFALVAPSRTGKTTLTAELCKSDFELMTDDMMALHYINEQYVVYPSWPVARMWPETLQFIEDNDSINNTTKSNQIIHEKVHEQFEKRTVEINNKNGFNFSKAPKKLKTIYLLNRLSTEQELTVNQQKNQVHHADLTLNNTEGFKKENKNSSKVNLLSNVCNITTISSSQAVIILLQNSILGSAYCAIELEKTRIEQLTQLLQNVSFKKLTYLSGKQNLEVVKEFIINDLNKD